MFINLKWKTFFLKILVLVIILFYSNKTVPSKSCISDLFNITSSPHTLRVSSGLFQKNK